MNQPARFKAIVYTIALFAAGAICGAVIIRKASPPPAAQPLKLERVDEIAAKIREKLKTRLELTPAQLQRAEPLIRMASQKLEDAHRDCLSQVECAAEQLHKELCPILTDGQKSKLKEMDSERADSLKQKYGYVIDKTNLLGR